ncbi:PREDICTED: ribosomal RNA-processing protein 7 homolog A [Ceratosolen solmsi marchali]|uniref:Ribosomal RNA-processing protein 7 homolog A n=1 Tax=Ceratosolen solmsi marchali TaxID=326594 RepID=A0AAJ6YJB7_9HYME|nr:PREDICTED: ribosomal RNA-processing protein 7 homolog A [Ceratosolen solmsi marchali]
MKMNVDKKKIGNFNTIWIRFDATNSDRHQLFIKEHSVKKQEPEYPRGQTLFVLNIPPYADVDSIKNAFTESCGPIKSVTFVKNANNVDLGFKNGYIVFARELGLQKALSLNERHTLTLNTSSTPILTGIAKWCKNYNESIMGESEIKKLIDNYMNEYDKKVEKDLRDEKMIQETVDNDGWTTITGKKKRGQYAPARKESTIQKVQYKEEEKKHKKQLLNFYTFQIREAKKQNLAELRKKFELDKKKLEQIKTVRKFKPF